MIKVPENLEKKLELLLEETKPSIFTSNLSPVEHKVADLFEGFFFKTKGLEDKIKELERKVEQLELNLGTP